MAAIWSNTDFPYMCLKDKKRTLAFKRAIYQTVKSGDVVVDAGSGSGILALFAAQAGAKHVYAVEIDRLLAAALKKTIHANGFSKQIEVVNDDIFTAKRPKAVDVLISELMETALLDELQVPALNHLQRRGVITSASRLIPSRYRTWAQLIWSDHRYYGLQILAPKHEWPFYRVPAGNWLKTKIRPVSGAVKMAEFDFSATILQRQSTVLEFEKTSSRPATGLLLRAEIDLGNGYWLRATNALNGDKILPLEPITTKEVKLKLDYRLGGGLGTLKIKAQN